MSIRSSPSFRCKPWDNFAIAARVIVTPAASLRAYRIPSDPAWLSCFTCVSVLSAAAS